MIPFAVSFIAGIAAFNFFPFFPFSISMICILALAFLFLRHPTLPPSRPESKDGSLNNDKREHNSVTGDSAGKMLFGNKFLLIFIFAFGFLYSFARQDSLPEIRFPDEAIHIEGTIVDVPEMREENLRLTLDKVIMEGRKIRGRVRLFVLPELSGNNFGGDILAPGNRVSVIAKLKEPVALRNPGVYTYDLKKEGIIATGYTRHVRLVKRGSGFPAWINKNRQRFGTIIDKSLSAESASFHKAIIPGLKRGISQEMRDAFGSTGLAHLLSISGTHFGLLAFMVFLSARSIIKYLPTGLLTKMTLYTTPSETSVLVTMPVLFMYALISGASTPTLRSLIMVFIYMLALFLGRKGQWLNSLSIAAVIILLGQPATLFDLSFLLSFIAVLSIGCLIEKRQKHEEQKTDPFAHPGIKEKTTKMAEIIRGISEKTKTTMLITIAALLGTAPIVALVFKQFPLISLVTNLTVTPIVCFLILPLSFVTGFSALLLDLPQMPLSGLTDAVTRFTLRLIDGFSNVPNATVHIHDPSFALIAIYFLSLLFLLKAGTRWKFLPFVFVISLYMVSPNFSANHLRVTFLDVGQGESSVVELPDKKVMLIDGGMHDPDMGRRVIAPHLWSKGIKKVDYMVMSHPHPDHYGGLIYIMDNFKVGEVWFSGRVTAEAADFFRKINEDKIPYKILGRGDILDAGKYKIYVLHPYEGFYADSPRADFSDQNSDSLVLKIESGNRSILFTGDIEREAEEDLIHLGDRLKSDIIKVPHHGGRTSNSALFIQTVSPRRAVISAGRNNPYRHPHQESLERYIAAGTGIFRTDISGAVIVTLDNKAFEITTYQDSRPLKVSAIQDEIRNLRLLF